MPSIDATCVVCGNTSAKSEGLSNEDGSRLICPSCGTYIADGELLESQRQSGEPPLAGPNAYILSGVLRRASNKGVPLRVSFANADDLASAAAPPESPMDAMDLILRDLLHRQQSAADTVLYQQNDYPVAFAKNGEEFQFLLEQLAKEKLIEMPQPKHWRLTVDGWKRVRQLRQRRLESEQAFVAMWFTDELRSAWEDGFSPALRDAGYNPLRIDSVEHNEKIDDRIVAEIRRSALLVADFTGGRGGVYFEAGLAVGLDIPVIWTCRSDHVDQLHLDTRQYNHIVWKRVADLRERLVQRIRATAPSTRSSMNTT